LGQQIVDFLLSKSQEKFEIQSALAVENVPDLWVYLAATMNPNLRRLLEITPGVLVFADGIKCQGVSSEDLRQLRAKKSVSTASLEVGTWVKVRRGYYRKNVGFVARISPEKTKVHILLIPHKTRVFDALYASHERSIPLTNDALEHGLIIKEYSSSLLSVDVSEMSLQTFNYFRHCNHPILKGFESTFPKPSEWEFSVDEEVFIHSGDEDCYRKTGLVSVIGKTEVELTSEEGMIKAKWMDIRKVIRERDFVVVTGGADKGWQGWVISVN